MKKLTAEECGCGDEYGHCIRFQMGEHFAPEPDTDEEDDYDDPENETCSWCSDLVKDATLYETKDGARICVLCVQKAQMENDQNACNGCDQDPWRKPAHYGDCALAEEPLDDQGNLVGNKYRRL